MDAHRSFRLTRSDPKGDTPGAGLVYPLAQQFIVLGFASLILDGGTILQIFTYAAVAHWACIAIILIRRRTQLTRIDKIVIRVGFVVACAISVVLTGFIWRLRGI